MANRAFVLAPLAPVPATAVARIPLARRDRSIGRSTSRAAIKAVYSQFELRVRRRAMYCPGIAHSTRTGE